MISTPNGCIASQRDEPDSVFVLAITTYKLDRSTATPIGISNEIRKMSYIAVGARINVSLANGQEHKQVYIKSIQKDSIKITGDILIPITDIKQIKVGNSWRRVVSKTLGGIALSIGIISTFGIISLANNLTSGSSLLLLLFWIPGILLVLTFTNKYPKFNFSKSRFALGVVSMSDLSSKVRKKLFERSHFYHKRF